MICSLANRRKLALRVLLAHSFFILAVSASAQTVANFGNVNLCPVTQNAAVCTKVVQLPPIFVPPSGAAPFVAPTVSVQTDGALNLDFQLAGVQSLGNNAYQITVAFRPKFAGLRRGMVTFQDQYGDTLAEQPIFGVGVGAQLGFGFSYQTAVQTGIEADALVVDGAGNLFFSNCDAQTISMVPPGGSPKVILSGIAAAAMAIDGGGNLYAGDVFSQQLVEIKPGQTPRVLMNGVNPSSIAVDGSANVYFADQISGNVFEMSDGVAIALSSGGSYTAVALDGSGNLFVQMSNGQAFEIAPNNQQTFVASNLEPIGGLFTDASSLYVVTATSLEKYPLSSTPVLTPVSGNIPLSAAISGSGNIFYIDPYDHRIVEVNRTPATMYLNAAGQKGNFEIENTGNALMSGVVIYLDGVQFGQNCQSLNPGSTCVFSLDRNGPVGDNPPLQVLFNSEGQEYSIVNRVEQQNPAVATMSAIQAASRLEQSGIAAEVLVAAPPTATGTITFTFDSIGSCVVPLSAGFATCNLPLPVETGVTSLMWQAKYSGDSVTSGALAQGKMLLQNKSSCFTNWNLQETCPPSGTPPPTGGNNNGPIGCWNLCRVQGS